MKQNVLRTNFASKSPLRYPGGKTRAVRQILALIPPDITSICSPFLGGGSVEIACAQRGIEVWAYDLFEPLVCFWQELLAQPSSLAKEVKKYHPLTKAEFYLLQRNYSKLSSDLQKAAVFYVLNRASFSGITLSGGMSPGHPRFTETHIENLCTFYTSSFNVGLADYRDSLAQHPQHFLYLDPPYANGEKLYGVRGDMQEDFDHENLAKLLHNRRGWILSYNDCARIRDLYAGFEFKVPHWTYGMNNGKSSNEVLICYI